MSIGTLLLAAWAIMYGGHLAGWFTISAKLLGVWLFITGIVLVLEHVSGYSLPRPNWHRS